MVQTAAAVGGAPILVTVRPPGIEFFVGGDEVTHGIDEAGPLPAEQGVDFDRRMADDFEQLLV